jgi:tetratricopeptide (TPR) repeat protein
MTRRAQASSSSRCVRGAAFVGVTALVCSALVPAPRSHAQARPQAPASEAQDGEARLLFEAASRAFADARYDTALARFREAYTLSARPALLYNIGQCADRLRRDDEALEAFERYLAAMPDAPNAAEVRTRIAALRAAQARQAEAIAAARAGAAAAPATPAPANSNNHVAPPATSTATAPTTANVASSATVVATPTVTPPPRETRPLDRATPARDRAPGDATQANDDAPAPQDDAAGELTTSGGGAPTWAVVGTFVGVGVAAAGIIPAVMARGTRGELDALCDADRFCPAEAQSLIDRGNSEALAADVLFGVGGALAIGFGLAWWLVEADEEAPVTATAACDGRGCAVGVGGRF